MSKYKKGDKLVIKIAEVFEGTLGSGYTLYKLDNNTFITPYKYKLESLSEYTEPLENRINELIEENNKLKEQLKLMNMLDAPTLISEEDGRRMDINKARAEGQNEAWELARKIVAFKWDGGYDLKEIKELFGYGCIQDIMKNFIYSEAAAKVEAWEKAKEEIKVGDIIKVDVNGLYAIVIHESDEFAKVVYADGNVYLGRKDGMTKTGRHIDIDGFLKQIRGEE